MVHPFWLSAFLLTLDIIPPCISFEWPFWIGPTIMFVLLILPASFAAPVRILRFLWWIAWGFALYRVFTVAFPSWVVVFVVCCAILKLVTPLIHVLYLRHLYHSDS